jgi:hypothetical protein
MRYFDNALLDILHLHEQGQTSLEQIFNTFAQRQAEETAVAPGRGIISQAQTDANSQPNGTNAVSGPSLV